MTRCFEGCWSSTSQLATKRNSDDNSGLVGCVMREIKGTGAWGARYKCATSSLATRSRLETRTTRFESLLSRAPTAPTLRRWLSRMLLLPTKSL